MIQGHKVAFYCFESAYTEDGNIYMWMSGTWMPRLERWFRSGANVYVKDHVGNIVLNAPHQLEQLRQAFARYVADLILADTEGDGRRPSGGLAGMATKKRKKELLFHFDRVEGLHDAFWFFDDHSYESNYFAEDVDDNTGDLVTNYGFWRVRDGIVVLNRRSMAPDYEWQAGAECIQVAFKKYLADLILRDSDETLSTAFHTQD